MKTIEKKASYEQPKMQVIEVQVEKLLTDGSGGESGGPTVGPTVDPTEQEY